MGDQSYIERKDSDGEKQSDAESERENDPEKDICIHYH